MTSVAIRNDTEMCAAKPSDPSEVCPCSTLPVGDLAYFQMQFYLVSFFVLSRAGDRTYRFTEALSFSENVVLICAFDE